MTNNPNGNGHVKAIDQDKLVADSVQSRAHEVNGAWFGVGAPGLNRLLFYRQKSDLDIPPYGYGGRGTALRRVWRLVGADIVASALAIMIQKVQATAYTIDGPQRTVGQAQQMIDAAELGAGWLQFAAKWTIDFCSQDNGAFVEKLGSGAPLKVGGVIQRHPDGMPVIDVSKPLQGKPISISCMDSIACERTGVYDVPVRYYDINGSMHLMNSTRVNFVADMPQPDERLFGYGFCAMSRCISMIQYAVNWATARNESLDNMPPLSIMALENINEEKFQEQMAAYEAQRQADSFSLQSSVEPVLRSLMTLVSQDPTKPVNVKLTPIRQLWESFDEQKAFQTTVNVTAMAFGLDPQELAPLSSSAMGSAAQSTVLDEKARGKGLGNILAHLEALMRDVLPASTTFRFDRQDDAEDLRKAQIHETKARTVIWLYTGSTGKSGGGSSGDANAAPTAPITSLLPGTDSPTPTSLIDRQQAQRLLMFEIPEWADILDPDMTLRNEVTVDDLDPMVADMQQKMYGPRVRFHSKARRTILRETRAIKKEFASDDSRRWFFANNPQFAIESSMPHIPEGASREERRQHLEKFADTQKTPVSDYLWDTKMIDFNSQGQIAVDAVRTRETASDLVKESRDASLPRDYLVKSYREFHAVEGSDQQIEGRINREYAQKARAVLLASHVDDVKLTEAQTRRLQSIAEGNYLKDKYSQYASGDRGTLQGVFQPRRGRSDFISAQGADLRAMHYEQINRKAFDHTADDFTRRFSTLVEGAASGSVTRPQFESGLLNILSDNGSGALRDGLRAGGSDGNIQGDAHAALQKFLSEQKSYVNALADDIYGSTMKTKAWTDSLDTIKSRAQLWINKSLRRMYEAGRLFSAPYDMYEFTGADGVESCPDCQRLKGQVHPLIEWHHHQLVPNLHTDSFDCGGWRCQHELAPTNAAESGNW